MKHILKVEADIPDDELEKGAGTTIKLKKPALVMLSGNPRIIAELLAHSILDDDNGAIRDILEMTMIMVMGDKLKGVMKDIKTMNSFLDDELEELKKKEIEEKLKKSMGKPN